MAENPASDSLSDWIAGTSQVGRIVDPMAVAVL
jgi:hypothetical protein